MDPSYTGILWLFFLSIIIAAVAAYYYYSRRTEQQKTQKDSYLLALKYMAENNRRLAIEKLKETVRYDSENIDAYIKLGDILRQEGLFYNAIRIHKDLSLRGTIGTKDRHHIWLSLALDYWSSKNFVKAEEYFKKLVDISEYRPEVIEYLVRISIDKEDYKAAFEYLKQSPSSDEDKVKKRLAVIKVMQGLELAARADGKNARIIFKDALKLDPGCAPAYMYIGDTYEAEDRRNDAIHIWTEFCTRFPEKSSVLFSRLEKAWYDKGHFSKIEELYESILKKNANNIEALLALCRFHCKKGDYETALSLIQEGLKQDMDEYILRAEWASILFEKNDFKTAAELSIDILENKLSISGNKYRCPECGHSSGEPFWKCPKCKSLITEF